MPIFEWVTGDTGYSTYVQGYEDSQYIIRPDEAGVQRLKDIIAEVLEKDIQNFGILMINTGYNSGRALLLSDTGGNPLNNTMNYTDFYGEYKTDKTYFTTSIAKISLTYMDGPSNPPTSINGARFVVKYNSDKIMQNAIKNYALPKTNTTEYTPTEDYNPATKKYVDDAINDINVSVGVEEKVAINPCFYFNLGSFVSITDNNLTQDTIQSDSDGNNINYSDLMPMLDVIITNYLKNIGGILMLKPYYEELLPFKVNWATETDALMTSLNIFKGEDGNLYTANIRVQGTYDETIGFTTTSFTIKSYADTTIATKKYVDEAISTAITTALEAEY